MRLPNLVILEGPDGAGKSTLGESLSRDLGWPYIHTGGAANTVDELEERMVVLTQTDRPAILDRCPQISDAIYKTALGRPLLVSQAAALTQILVYRPVLIYCRRRPTRDMLNSILETQKGHKPPEYLERVKENYHRIVQGYDETMHLLRQAGMDVFEYNWKLHCYPKLKELIAKCAA